MSISEILNNSSYEPSKPFSESKIDYFNPLLTHDMVSLMLKEITAENQYILMNSKSDEYKLLSVLSNITIKEEKESSDSETGEDTTTDVYNYTTGTKAFYAIVYGIYSAFFTIDDILNYIKNILKLDDITEDAVLSFANYVNSEEYYNYKADLVKKYLEDENVLITNEVTIDGKPSINEKLINLRDNLNDEYESSTLKPNNYSDIKDIDSCIKLNLINPFVKTQRNGFEILKNYLNTTENIFITTTEAKDGTKVKKDDLTEMYPYLKTLGLKIRYNAKTFPEISFLKNTHGNYFTSNSEDELFLRSVLTNSYKYLSIVEYNESYDYFIKILVNTIDEYNKNIQKKVKALVFDDTSLTDLENDYTDLLYNKNKYISKFKEDDSELFTVNSTEKTIMTKLDHSIISAEEKEYTDENNIAELEYELLLSETAATLKYIRNKINEVKSSKIVYSKLDKNIPIKDAYENMVKYTGNTGYTNFRNLKFLVIAGKVIEGSGFSGTIATRLSNIETFREKLKENLGKKLDKEEWYLNL